MEKESEKSKNENDEDAFVLSCCSFSPEETRRLANGSDLDRAKATAPLSTLSKETVLSLEKMTFLEELACILFLTFGPPTGALSIPLLVALIGKYLVGNIQYTFIVYLVLTIPLAILPQPYVPSTLQSWMSVQVQKYFSFRFIVEERPRPKKNASYVPRILVAPPHGVFPYGNILSLLAYPTLCGYPFRGLASSAALRPPIFKQILRSIGIIDASRHIARQTLENNDCIGIATGGVAEVFETNADDECILLKERIGLIKLAIRTGSEITPCYLFGNTKILSCWAGEGIPYARPILEKISRKIGFALILFYGRFGLPIPRRTPLLAVMGKSIPTKHMKCEEPTNEQIFEIQKLLLDEMQDIFDRYKGYYGWDNKHLIIK